MRKGGKGLYKFKGGGVIDKGGGVLDSGCLGRGGGL